MKSVDDYYKTPTEKDVYKCVCGGQFYNVYEWFGSDLVWGSTDKCDKCETVRESKITSKCEKCNKWPVDCLCGFRCDDCDEIMPCKCNS